MVVVVVVVESERWSTLKGGNKTGGGMTVSVLHFCTVYIVQEHRKYWMKKKKTVSYPSQ